MFYWKHSIFILPCQEEINGWVKGKLYFYTYLQFTANTSWNRCKSFLDGIPLSVWEIWIAYCVLAVFSKINANTPICYKYKGGGHSYIRMHTQNSHICMSMNFLAYVTYTLHVYSIELVTDLCCKWPGGTGLTNSHQVSRKADQSLVNPLCINRAWV